MSFGFRSKTVLLQILLILLVAHGVDCYCRVEECSNWFQKTKEYEYLKEQRSVRYCQVLETFRTCLSDSFRHCRGNLKYHSVDYLMKKQWNDYRCSNIDLKRSTRNTCYFVPASSQKAVRFTSVFGNYHVRQLDGSFTTCNDLGARTLIDNRYFLVQVTARPIKGEIVWNAIQSVTVLLRGHNCTRQMVYSTSVQDVSLPKGFQNGISTVDTEERKRAVEVLLHDESYVELSLRYIDSSVHIRRIGRYFNVAVRAPEHVLKATSTTSHQISWSGCRTPSSTANLARAVTVPHTFAQCYGTRVHIPVAEAHKKCLEVSLTDSFLDSCVYDLISTGDLDVITASRLAQTDFQRVFPSHYHYMSSRKELNLIQNISTIEFDDCVPQQSVTGRNSSLILVFTVILFLFL